jgi:hypothetical protein
MALPAARLIPHLQGVRVVHCGCALSGAAAAWHCLRLDQCRVCKERRWCTAAVRSVERPLHGTACG